ncbi:Uncharacterised protein [Mycobacteroides abscessus subsp. abscessus]|nr:Uncharacterised protein [Mycobacteroides abscessus subsp. abscessus]
MRSSRSKSLEISSRMSGGLRFPATAPSSAPPAMGAAPRASSASAGMAVSSSHQDRRERAAKVIGLLAC